MSSRPLIGAIAENPYTKIALQQIEIDTLKNDLNTLHEINHQLAAMHERAEQLAHAHGVELARAQKLARAHGVKLARAQQVARACDVELDRVKRANATMRDQVREEITKLETAVHQNLNKTEIDDILRKIMSTVVNIRAVTPPPPPLL